MEDNNLNGNNIVDDKKENKSKKRKPEFEPPKQIDLKAAHRKVMAVMIGAFVAILFLMLACQEHVDFASTGGM